VDVTNASHNSRQSHVTINFIASLHTLLFAVWHYHIP